MLSFWTFQRSCVCIFNKLSYQRIEPAFQVFQIKEFCYFSFKFFDALFSITVSFLNHGVPIYFVKCSQFESLQRKKNGHGHVLNFAFSLSFCDHFNYFCGLDTMIGFRLLELKEECSTGYKIIILYITIQIYFQYLQHPGLSFGVMIFLYICLLKQFFLTYLSF